MIGEWRDRLILPGGRDLLLGEGKNLIVNSAYVLMARLMKDPTDPTGGLLYWALGDGNTADTNAWNAAIAAGTQQAAATQVALLNEIYRKAIPPENIVFVDGTNSVSGSPTNRLRIITTFLATEPSAVSNTNLREWGLFGGDATGTAGSGTLINSKQHTTYVKTTSAILERTLFLTF